MALAAIVALAVLGFAPQAPAAVYWGDSGAIGGADDGGGNANPDYFRPHFPASGACDLAVSGTYLYWANWFGIWRVNLEGPAMPTEIVPGLANPCGIAIDGSYVYWVNRSGGAIGRAALDGSNRNDNFLSGLNGPCGVAVDGHFIYWVGWPGIGRARIDGTGIESAFIATGPSDCGIAVDAGHVYWGGWDEEISRANLDGGEVDHDFIAVSGSVSSIAVDSGHIYWTERPEGMAFSSIGIETFGAEPVRAWIPTDVFQIGGVAVDGRQTPPPLPVPSFPIHLGQVHHDRRHGTAIIDVFVPERGDLVVSAPALGWRVNKGPTPPPWRGGSFHWRLKLWAGGMGRSSDRIRRQLAEHGRAVLPLQISYNEVGQLPVQARKTVVLLKRRRR